MLHFDVEDQSSPPKFVSRPLAKSNHDSPKLPKLYPAPSHVLEVSKQSAANLEKFPTLDVPDDVAGLLPDYLEWITKEFHTIYKNHWIRVQETILNINFDA